MKIYVDELPKNCDDCELGYFYDCQYCSLRPELAREDKTCQNYFKYSGIYPLFMQEYELDNTQSLKQQVREEVVEEIRERLKKAHLEIMSPIDLYSYTDNFLYQVEKGETK